MAAEENLDALCSLLDDSFDDIIEAIDLEKLGRTSSYKLNPTELNRVARNKEERLKKQPYGECIKMFRKLSSTFSPSDKLDLITNVCKLVDENI